MTKFSSLTRVCTCICSILVRLAFGRTVAVDVLVHLRTWSSRLNSLGPPIRNLHVDVLDVYGTGVCGNASRYKV